MPVKDDVLAMLSAERGGKKLGGGLVDLLSRYLVDVAMVKDVNEVIVQDLKETASEAWQSSTGEALPAMHAKSLASWIRGTMLNSSTRSVDGSESWMMRRTRLLSLACRIRAPATSSRWTMTRRRRA